MDVMEVDVMDCKHRSVSRRHSVGHVTRRVRRAAEKYVGNKSNTWEIRAIRGEKKKSKGGTLKRVASVNKI